MYAIGMYSKAFGSYIAATGQVQETLDGQVVVLHDSSLQRLCGVSRRVQDTLFKDLPRIRLPSHFDPHRDPAGVPWKEEDFVIPLLESLLLLCPPHIPMQIDLKDGTESLVVKTIALLKTHGRLKTTLIGSFKYSTSKLLRKATENGSMIPLFMPFHRALLAFFSYRVGLLWTMTLYESALIIPNAWLFRDEGFIRTLQETHGISVLVFGRMNDSKDFSQWQSPRLRADGLCTDRPLELSHWLSANKEELSDSKSK